MIRLIVALDNKRGIAKNGVQPWKLHGDEQYFKDMTLRYGARILMGRPTLEVIGHPLPNRTNYVVTRQDSLSIGEGVVQKVHNLQDWLASNTEDIWIIGGAAIYEQTIDQANELYITEIEADFGCDKFFPDYSNFELVSRSQPLTENGVSYSYAMYRPKQPAETV